MTTTFQAIEFDNAGEAIQHAEWDDGEAVLVFGRNMVVDTDTLDRLFAAGVEFAYLHSHVMPDGQRRIVTVPVSG